MTSVPSTATSRRTEFATLIVDRLRAQRPILQVQFAANSAKIGYFYVDDLLPEAVAQQLYANFPRPDTMTYKRSLRERKYISAQMNQHAPLLEEALFAFQDQRVVNAIGEICGIAAPHADPALYAGGISLMRDGDFLNPHLDNSHDKDMRLWRVLNVLYYVTPDWDAAHGGNLELWPEGVGRKRKPTTLHSRFNRMVVMATHDASWHSVSPVRGPAPRCCISNYYFSATPVRSSDTFHVTSFRARPEQPIRNLALRADNALRMGIRRLIRRGVMNKDHLYTPSNEKSSAETREAP
jgi:Rps23 Pro-64 3,4-dihydroxylase Tpa1-like proline 4-hydroxylase